jgi:hypothetical protein
MEGEMGTESKAGQCEMVGCGRSASATENGIAVCEPCGQGFVSVGFGAVERGGRWYGVRGALYTAEQAAAFPGLVEGHVEVPSSVSTAAATLGRKGGAAGRGASKVRGSREHYQRIRARSRAAEKRYGAR